MYPTVDMLKIINSHHQTYNNQLMVIQPNIVAIIVLRIIKWEEDILIISLNISRKFATG